MERLELNLHSNMSLLNYTIHLATYISFRFTFRYVSILITSSRDFLVRRLGFTFQYVSILIGSHFIGYCLDIE